MGSKSESQEQSVELRGVPSGQAQNCPKLVWLPHGVIPQPWGCPAGTERTFGLKVPEGNSRTGVSWTDHTFSNAAEMKRKRGAHWPQVTGSLQCVPLSLVAHGIILVAV